jgi:hypothetical protein
MSVHEAILGLAVAQFDVSVGYKFYLHASCVYCMSTFKTIEFQYSCDKTDGSNLAHTQALDEATRNKALEGVKVRENAYPKFVLQNKRID